MNKEKTPEKIAGCPVILKSITALNNSWYYVSSRFTKYHTDLYESLMLGLSIASGKSAKDNSIS